MYDEDIDDDNILELSHNPPPYDQLDNYGQDENVNPSPEESSDEDDELNLANYNLIMDRIFPNHDAVEHEEIIIDSPQIDSNSERIVQHLNEENEELSIQTFENFDMTLPVSHSVSYNNRQNNIIILIDLFFFYSI